MQNELSVWQSDGIAGAHSRAWQVLDTQRAQGIADRMGLGSARSTPQCLGCHSDNAHNRGAKFQESDGVGCEACHGGSSSWLSSHYAPHVTHAKNLAGGMAALEDPVTRAGVCLDCHFGSADPNQFVSHRMMAAGHPQISFELDYFSEMQRHYRLGADYAARKPIAGDMKFWAVGQALALERALTLYDSHHGDGVLPDFYFFDCQSCHRAISSDGKTELRGIPNPGRPVPAGTPPFNDANAIMLLAIAKVAAPDTAGRLDEEIRDFHASLIENRESAIRTADALAQTARGLAREISARSLGTSEIKRVMDELVSDSLSARYTDWSGAAQVFYAVCDLKSALDPHYLCQKDRNYDALYRTVADPNAYKPAEFRRLLQQFASDGEGQH